jgi:DEAD/DEAH box helicase domain-containing protein
LPSIILTRYSFKDTLRLSPPDILLTNYKMLDFLLVRPRDYPLWKQNGPETLRFLVVDELHSFDGPRVRTLLG